MFLKACSSGLYANGISQFCALASVNSSGSFTSGFALLKDRMMQYSTAVSADMLRM